MRSGLRSGHTSKPILHRQVLTQRSQSKNIKGDWRTDQYKYIKILDTSFPLNSDEVWVSGGWVYMCLSPCAFWDKSTRSTRPGSGISAKWSWCLRRRPPVDKLNVSSQQVRQALHLPLHQRCFGLRNQTAPAEEEGGKCWSVFRGGQWLIRGQLTSKQMNMRSSWALKFKAV